jgi:hypothetical protein
MESAVIAASAAASAAVAAGCASRTRGRLVGREDRGVLFFRKGGLAMVAGVGILICTCIF